MQEPYKIVYIKSSMNNTFITVTSNQHQLLMSMTPAKLGYKGCRRSSALAAEALGLWVGTQLKKESMEPLWIKFHGIDRGRMAALKGLRKSGISIMTLQDITPLPHNGCKLSKPRRL